MKLTVTPQEYTFLSGLFREVQAAHERFRIAFESSVRCRGLEDVTFVSLSTDTLEVRDTVAGPTLVPDEVA